MAQLPDKLIARLDEIVEQFDEIERQLADPQVVSDHQRVRDLSIRRSAMEDLVDLVQRYRAAERRVEEDRQIVDAGDDAELVELARAELDEAEAEAIQLGERIANELVTADDRAIASVILEVRAGTGGAEAALWAGDLLTMYEQLAARKRWSFESMGFSEGEMGGVRQAMVNVQGPGVWQVMGYEAGVHCVKRVPATEAQGRVHTSTATVAVLPEPERLEIEIDPGDVDEHVTTAQGPGGQNVNKVATAVHLIHRPTGIEVRMQETKSQQQNRQKAWQLLRARLHEHHQQQKEAERAEARSAMIGTGGRSERVRTYRFKENIVVDHRIGESFNLQTILSGDIDELTEKLVAEDRSRRLAAL